MLCRAVRDEAAADSVWQCAGVRCSSQVAGLLAAVRSAVARSGKAVQAVQGAVAMSGKGAVRAPVQAAVGAAVAKSGKDAVQVWQGQLVQGAWEPASPRTVNP